MYPVEVQMTVNCEDALLAIQGTILAAFAPIPKEGCARSSCAVATWRGTFDLDASIATTL